MTPHEKRRAWIFWTAFLLLAVLFGAAWNAIEKNDRPLATTCTPTSAALEWVASPRAAEQIVNDWSKQPFDAISVVRNGVLIDTFFLIPVYVALFFLTLPRCGAAVESIDWWRVVGDLLSRLAAVAGVFDLVENAGILLELYSRWFWLAPVTAFFAILKWIILTVFGAFVLFSVVLGLREIATSSEKVREELQA